MENETVGIRGLKDKASSIIDRVEGRGDHCDEARSPRSANRLHDHPAVPVGIDHRRNGASARKALATYPPKPAKLKVEGKSTAEYVFEVGAEPLPRCQRADQAPGRRARSPGSPQRLHRGRRHPHHRDRSRRGDHGFGPNAQGPPPHPSGAGSSVMQSMTHFWRRPHRAPSLIRFAPTTLST